jgi:simple sugar transport system permease protein
MIRIRLEPRLAEPGPAEWLARTGAGLILALLLAVALIALAGYDPATSLGALYRGAFGSLAALAATLNKAVPIGLCALGIALAYRARLWNIGAEGQLYFGAFAATGIGLALPETFPPALAVAAVLIAGMLAGAAWAGLAALARAFLGMNEILSTLMLTYSAILWVGYLVTGPWADPLTFSFP